MIIKHSNEDINQSVQQHIAICHSMAGSKTYISPVYYNFWQPVTILLAQLWLLNHLATSRAFETHLSKSVLKLRKLPMIRLIWCAQQSITISHGISSNKSFQNFCASSLSSVQNANNRSPKTACVYVISSTISLSGFSSVFASLKTSCVFIRCGWFS